MFSQCQSPSGTESSGVLMFHEIVYDSNDLSEDEYNSLLQII